MNSRLVTDLAERVLERCLNDGEFRLAARYWNGAVRMNLPGEVVAIQLKRGSASRAVGTPSSSDLTFTAPDEVWEKLLSPLPPPMFNDIPSSMASGLQFSGDVELYWQYYPAIRRLVDLVREEWNAHVPV